MLLQQQQMPSGRWGTRAEVLLAVGGGGLTLGRMSSSQYDCLLASRARRQGATADCP